MKRLLSLFLAAGIAAALLGVHAANAATASAPATLSAAQAGEISTSYHYLTSEFYKRVDDQQVLNGAQAGLVNALGKQHVTGKVPALHASSDDANVRAIELDVEDAQRAAGKRVSSTDLTYAAIAGMLNSVHDRYTVFLDPKDYAELNTGLDGSDFGGTGIVIQEDDASKYIAVSDVVPDGPADKAGIQQDDLITAIDGQSTKGWTVDRASAHLRGKEGTKVSITVQRDGKTLSPYALTRAKIHQMSVFDKILPGNIGYVALTVFGKDTATELTAALGRLQKKGARAYILDLRNNGGGYLNAAVGVSSKFISAGPIVSVESRGVEHHDAGSQRHGDRARAAGGAGKSIHCIGVGDHLGCDSRQRRRNAGRNEDLRQRCRADDLSVARRVGGEDHNGALPHAAQSRHQPPRHRPGYRRCGAALGALRRSQERSATAARDAVR